MAKLVASRSIFLSARLLLHGNVNIPDIGFLRYPSPSIPEHWPRRRFIIYPLTLDPLPTSRSFDVFDIYGASNSSVALVTVSLLLV